MLSVKAYLRVRLSHTVQPGWPASPARHPLRVKLFRVLLRSEERRVGEECRSYGDWSSDVCSSDLRRGYVLLCGAAAHGRHRLVVSKANAHGSYLGCLASKRTSGYACRTRSSPVGPLPRLGIRCGLSSSVFS